MPDRSSLSDRLKLIRETAGGSLDGGLRHEDWPHGGRPAGASENGETVEPLEGSREPTRMPAGWEQIGAYTWKLESLFSVEENGPLTLFGSGRGNDRPKPVTSDRFLFFDTETTGLSGGAGTIIFLAGFGRIVPGGFLVRQYFLADYPGEGEFLSIILSRELGDPSILVTYNGRCFDFPLLRTRCILNGFPPPEIEQYDLLYPARVCWKRLLPGCSLKEVETGVMGITRKEDIPGYLVPERYFIFLRTGGIGGLADVFSHHAQDIRSLAVLVRILSEVWMNPGHGRPVTVDQRGLGNLLLRAGREEGEGVLMRGFLEGDLSAGLSLGVHLKRSGRHDEAVSVWEDAVERFDSAAARLALAKHHEHRSRNMANALRLTEELIARVSTGGPAADFRAGPADHVSLLRRRERLLRKMERTEREGE